MSDDWLRVLAERKRLKQGPAPNPTIQRDKETAARKRVAPRVNPMGDDEGDGEEAEEENAVPEVELVTRPDLNAALAELEARLRAEIALVPDLMISHVLEELRKDKPKDDAK